MKSKESKILVSVFEFALSNIRRTGLAEAGQEPLSSFSRHLLLNADMQTYLAQIENIYKWLPKLGRGL